MPAQNSQIPKAAFCRDYASSENAVQATPKASEKACWMRWLFLGSAWSRGPCDRARNAEEIVLPGKDSFPAQLTQAPITHGTPK